MRRSSVDSVDILLLWRMNLKKNYNNALIDWKVSELTFNRLKKFFFEIADKSQKLQI